MFKRLLLFAIAVCQCVSEEPPSVLTKSGKIIGHYLTSFAGKRYEAYQGVPYALPPVGERRFQPPIPFLPWAGELVANHLRSSCWQHDRVPFPSGSFVKGDEDCLYLNVFVPKRKANGTLPVLFWIYGGGFRYGANHPDEESYLMDHEVILVTIQYRLGALGFLSTEDEVVPGNMGLKDQSLALRWVHDNIANFGGDPNKITLFGQSAGGASVQYHYLSPMSAGLFQSGFSYSGTAFNWWAQSPKNPREKALELGRMMNCSTSNIQQMTACLRNCPARDLVKARSTFMPGQHKPALRFGPVAEKFSKDSFIDRLPDEIVAGGQFYDAPWVTGVVSEEGLFPMAEFTDDAVLKNLNENWHELAPLLLDYYDSIPKEHHASIAQAIRKHYLDRKSINKETFRSLVHLVGDSRFVVDVEKAARAQAKVNKSPVWFYRYSYRATDSMSFKLSNSTEDYGVCHGDDVYLFMKNNYINPTKSSEDLTMQRKLMKALVSFATEGTPNFNAEWSRVGPTGALDYLDIRGPGNIKMKSTDDLGQRQFWNLIDGAKIRDHAV